MIWQPKATAWIDKPHWFYYVDASGRIIGEAGTIDDIFVAYLRPLAGEKIKLGLYVTLEAAKKAVETAQEITEGQRGAEFVEWLARGGR